MQRSQKVEIIVFGIHLGWASSQIIRITHDAQIAYLRFRLKQQDYKNRILTVRL